MSNANVNTDTCAAKPRSSFWRRLGFVKPWNEELFNWRNTEEEGFAPSAMSTVVEVRFDFIDRLRVLLSGRVRVETYTKTDVIILRCNSRSEITVLPPSRPKGARDG